MKVKSVLNILPSKCIRYFLCLVLFISVFSDNYAQNKFRWVLGEELTYKVKYGFLRLGTLTMQVADSMQMDEQKVYKTLLYIDSNPMIFFVNMHSVYESYIDENFYPHLFLADEKIDGKYYKTRYRFDYPNKIIDVKMTDLEDTSKIIIKQMPMEEKVQDGMSLIFYARGNVHLAKEETLTAFYEAKKGKILIRFKGKGESLRIDAFESSQKSYAVDGQAHIKAIAGFGGKYEGWFATDAQAPPLKAKLKVFIGYVTVELESWKNWFGKNASNQNATMTHQVNSATAKMQ
ncbi:DUF3108 domain-containing protein [candidate division KSB1 bacterium]|nr:DUF3108 domain-containing protein [candidate division KSB1 bacterium]